MKKYFLLLPFMLIGFFCIANQNAECSNCPSPANVTVVAKNSGSISFDWDNVGAANEYEIWYVRQSDGHTSPTSTSPFSNFSFSGLQAGDYDFYFVTVCGSGRSVDIIIHDIVIN